MDEFRAYQFYVDKIMPMKQFAVNCTAIHQILKTKEEYKNFMIFEHQ